MITSRLSCKRGSASSRAGLSGTQYALQTRLSRAGICSGTSFYSGISFYVGGSFCLGVLGLGILRVLLPLLVCSCLSLCSGLCFCFNAGASDATAAEPEVSDHQALHIAFVIDASDAVSASLLEEEKTALLAALGLLRTRDRATIVFTSRAASSVLSLDQVSYSEQFRASLARISSGGSPNLFSGLSRAIHELGH